MAELNEKQLLLLDCLVYVDADFSNGRSLGDIASELLEPGGLDGVDIGASMTKEEVTTLLQDLQNDETLKTLVVDGYVNTEIRGACFVDPATQEAVVVYRGTGPAYAAWDDNCQGGYLSDTDMQKEALEFAKKTADKYGDITVTGHSKGGNLAQYVTVVMGDQVDRCVSFDGQGFGDEFLEKYADEIAANKHKIRSVNAHNDYVNILLTAIADETVYLANDKKGLLGHSPYGIYEHADNTLTNGEYTTSKEQNKIIKGLKEGLDWLVEKLDGLDNNLVEFLVYSFVGAIMGGALSDQVDLMNMDLLDWIKVIGEFLENLDDYIEDYNNTKNSGGNSHVAVTVDTAALRDTSEVMTDAAAKVETLYGQIQKIRKQMATNVISGVAIGAPLQAVLKQMDKEAAKLKKLAAFLANSADLYDATEKDNKNLD